MCVGQFVGECGAGAFVMSVWDSSGSECGAVGFELCVLDIWG